MRMIFFSTAYCTLAHVRITSVVWIRDVGVLTRAAQMSANDDEIGVSGVRRCR
ncbi:MAG: hypothetical protein MSC53_02445 [Arcanobacterium sp.]|nr:hypothetical protein [Arcanobacterium sp.]MDY5273148.1 hypothetical protein [Arcanobacterium sp.]